PGYGDSLSDPACRALAKSDDALLASCRASCWKVSTACCSVLAVTSAGSTSCVSLLPHSEPVVAKVWRPVVEEPQPTPINIRAAAPTAVPGKSPARRKFGLPALDRQSDVLPRSPIRVLLRSGAVVVRVECSSGRPVMEGLDRECAHRGVVE